jgi:hypothetical protein
MYYPASDTIAVKWPKWRTAIEQIDQLLHDNAGKLVRVDFIASFVDESARTVEQLLKEYAERNVIELIQTHCCPKHPDVLLDPQQKNSTLYCDLCDQDYEQSSLLSSNALRIVMPNQPHVFISHSSADKPFVRRLVEDLKKQDIPVWFDESDILVGDSIVQKINSALSESDYLIVVLSKASVQSAWVKNELDYALMEEKSKDSIVILPVKIDDCEIPPLLRSRLYADFSQDYATGLKALQRVFSQEKLHLVEKIGTVKQLTNCEQSLAALSEAELRRRLKRMSRDELAVVWYDLFVSRMKDDMDGRTHSECLLELLLRAGSRNKTAELIRSVCSERGDLGEDPVNP